MRLHHPAPLIAAAAVTLGAVLATVTASSQGALWKMLLVAVALGLPGALSASIHPRNPVGWLLLAVAAVLSTMGLAAQTDWSGAAGDWATWLVERGGAVVVPLMFLVLVLLPDGRLLSPRWRPAVVVAVAVQVAVVAAWCLAAAEPGEVRNPAGVLPADRAGAIDTAGDWVLQGAMVLAVAAIVVRLRRPDDRAGLAGALGGAVGFGVLSVLGHSLLPRAADALDVLGAVVLGAGLTLTLLHRSAAPAPGAPTYDAAALAVLSAREQEVLSLVAEGLTNRQIAERLVISPVTARNHVSRILTKLDLDNRTQAAAWLAGRAREPSDAD